MLLRWKIGASFVAGSLVTVFVLHPPLTSQDWAAWVQAIGSVLAIVVAILVVRHQSDSDRRLEKARRDLDKIHRFESVRAVMAIVSSITTSIKEELDDAQFEKLAANTVKYLDGIDQAVKAFPLVEMPNNVQTVMLVTLYNAGPKLGLAISRFCSAMHEGQVQRDKKHLDDIYSQIDSILEISKESKERCESSVKELQAGLPFEMRYSMKEGK